MHGYIDSIHVPINLHTLTQLPKQGSTSSSAKGKGKQKATPNTDNGGAAGGGSYDVVANWSKEEKHQVERKVAMAAELGYSTLLLTISIPPTINPSLLLFSTPLLPSIDPRTAEKGREGLVLQMWRVNGHDYDEEAVKNAAVKGVYGFSNATAPLYPSSTTLLSVTPTCLPSLSHISISLSSPSPFSPSLISIDLSLSPRLPFPLKRGLVNSLLRAGVQIELKFAGMMEGGSEAGKKRRNGISGAREAVRALDGKGIVVTSGAKEVAEMRAPEGVVNLCTLIGLTTAQAKDSLTINSQRAILRGMSNTQTYRGVISDPTIITSTSTTNVEEGQGGKKSGKREIGQVAGSKEVDEGDDGGRKKVKN